MGGSIGVIIREEDGKVHCMTRNTNPLPAFFRSINFINKNLEYLKVYLNAPNFDCTHTLSPDEYGLVIIDYKNNLVIHNNHYSAFINNIIGENVYQDLISHYENDEWRKLCEENRVKLNKIKSVSGITKKVNKIISFEELKEIIDNEYLKSKNRLLFSINMKPWTFIRYKNNYRGFLNLKKKILLLGFKLNENDKKSWSEYLKTVKERKNN